MVSMMAFVRYNCVKCEEASQFHKEQDYETASVQMTSYFAAHSLVTSRGQESLHVIVLCGFVLVGEQVL